MLTSQRVVDAVLGAFGACAASQGCMNNVTFGDERFGYYETVAGGAGAVRCGEGMMGRALSGVVRGSVRSRLPEIWDGWGRVVGEGGLWCVEGPESGHLALGITWSGAYTSVTHRPLSMRGGHMFSRHL